MNIKYMEYFIRLAADESYSVAARKLGITQPTLTQAIQKIESSLGVSLFDRSGRDVKINEYGKLYLDTCKKVTKIYNDGVENISDIDHGTTGKIKIGIAPSRAPGIMPEIIGKFRKIFPETRIEIQEHLTLGIEKSVESGMLDVGILIVKEQNNSQLLYLPLARERILVAVAESITAQSEGLLSKSNPWDTKEVYIESFKDIPFILLGEEQLIVRQFRSACENACVDINCVARCRNYDTSLALANEGIGATLITDSCTDYYGNMFPNLRYYSVSDADLGRGLYLVYRKNMYKSDSMEAFINIVDEVYRNKTK